MEDKRKAMLFILLLSCNGIGGTIQVNKLSAPHPARAGDTIKLRCDWTTLADPHQKGKGYVHVKWFKDGEQLFKISKKKEGEKYVDEKISYHLPGINIVLQESNRYEVVLADVNRNNEGVYSCEVMGEGPKFRTMNASTILTVAEIPETPVMTGARSVYRIGEVVNVTCTAEHARPEASITFFVNGKRIRGRNGQVRMMTPFLEPSGAYTSSAVLTMRVQEQHRPMMRLTCRAKVISIHIEDSLNLRVEEAPHMLANWFGSGAQKTAISHFLMILEVLSLLNL